MTRFHFAVTNNKLNCPLGIALDKAQNLYVTDSLNHRVQVWERKQFDQ